MKEEDIQKLANGAPPDGECEPVIIWLAKEVLRLREELKTAYDPETSEDHAL
jgi:hypothetical protein